MFDPTDVSYDTILSVASRINITDPIVLAYYHEGQMCYDRVHEIMQEYGYRDFASQ